MHCAMQGACVRGALPPEMRRHQARLFNEPDNEYADKVTSHAVGLVLKIRRGVTQTLHKLEGAHHKPMAISVTEIRHTASPDCR